MLLEFAPGLVVVSKSGRDKGRYFIVVKTEGKFVYVVDGDLRKVENPKKKNVMHLRRTNIVLEDFAVKIKNNETFKNADIRKALAGLQSSEEVR